MKNLLLITLLMLSFTKMYAQNDNKLVFDEKSGKDILVGTVTREGLISMGDWFDHEYRNYQPDPAIIDSLKTNKNEYPWVFIVLGTWCSDSREQVPHFLKILDILDYPSEQIFMVAVDRNKKAGNFCVGDFNITLVPAFIFSMDGDETGRIVETPVKTLEQDFLSIIAGKDAGPGIK
ncbi:MAG: thioredoxin [Bacteroidota bacterium]